MKQTQTFQAEAKELLDLMIHSLYSHREIFLRELVSNATDAIEKLKFESLTNSSLGSETEFEIRLEADKEKRTLSILDNGIGMTHDEVVQNIGTIAHSGTKAFMKMRQELKTHPELIGQFGVGFYSAFMVADRVTVHTQKAGTDQGTLWESEAKGTYTIEEAGPRPTGHGTTIILHLKDLKKEDEESTSSEHSEDSLQDFTDFWTLKQIVKKYSDFVVYPIKMKRVLEDSKEGSETELKSQPKTQDETLNSQKALWLRTPSEITPEEYSEFYRQTSQDWLEPLKTIHYKAEGAMEFTSLLFIPSQKPMNYDYRDRQVGLNLYVKRVFIKGDCEELVPPYLRFIKGLVDSDDLSLNVSREILQQDRQIGRIKKALTSKILSSLRDLMANDRPSYEKFWNAFGATLKEGIALDASNNEKLQDLVLFHSTAGTGQTSLQEYLGRMKPDQKAIYYITGDSLSQIQNSPYLEKLKYKEWEVLLMIDKVDAWVATSLDKYQEKLFQSIMAEDLDLSSAEEKQNTQDKLKEAEAKFKPLIDTMQESLKEQVKEIKISDRLTESPVCLVAAGNKTSAHMERLLESMGQGHTKAKRIMEINPAHPLYEKMLHAPKLQQEEWADILYQQALLNEGSPIENPLQYSQRIANLMLLASNQPQ